MGVNNHPVNHVHPCSKLNWEMNMDKQDLKTENRRTLGQAARRLTNVRQGEFPKASPRLH